MTTRDIGTATTASGDAERWRWVQPPDRAALLQRLADARDFEVPARERENLCSVAHGEISRLAEALQDLVEESYSLVEPPAWMRPATGRGVYRCRCRTVFNSSGTHRCRVDCYCGWRSGLT